MDHVCISVSFNEVLIFEHSLHSKLLQCSLDTKLNFGQNKSATKGGSIVNITVHGIEPNWLKGIELNHVFE